MPHDIYPPSHWDLPNESLISLGIEKSIPYHWSNEAYFAWDLIYTEFSDLDLSSHSGQDYLIDKLASENNSKQHNNKLYFLDIGANDGISNSSTFFLEKKGWDGLLIEPNIYLINVLIKNRSSKVMCTAISDSNYISILRTSKKAHAIGSIDNRSDSFANKLLDKALITFGRDDSQELPVPVISASSLMKYFVKTFNQKPSFLKIDVEGLESCIIQDIMKAGFIPDFLEIENNLRQTYWAKLLRDIGYRCIFVLDANVELWAKNVFPKELLSSIINSSRL